MVDKKGQKAEHADIVKELEAAEWELGRLPNEDQAYRSYTDALARFKENPSPANRAELLSREGDLKRARTAPELKKKIRDLRRKAGAGQNPE
jgi:hypothetical protein